LARDHPPPGRPALADCPAGRAEAGTARPV